MLGTQKKTLFAFTMSSDNGSGDLKKSQSDDQLAKYNAEELGAALADSCIQFLRGHNLFTTNKSKFVAIVNDTTNIFDTSTIENHLPQEDHTKQVEIFWHQTRVCDSLLSNFQANSPLIKQIEALLGLAESLMNRAAKDLIKYYSSLGPQAQESVRRRTGDNFSIIEKIGTPSDRTPKAKENAISKV